MVLAIESSSCLMTPEKRPSRDTTNTNTNSNTGTRRTVGRSRRRRPITTPSSASASDSAAAAFDETDGKENNRYDRSRRRTNATAATPMRSSRGTNLTYAHNDDDDNDEQFGAFNAEKVAQSSSFAASASSTTPLHHHRKHGGDDEAKLYYETTVKEFRESLERISVQSTLWSEVPDLARTLVRISLSGSSTANALGLDGHVSALLSLCRKLIKNVSVEASGGGGGGGGDTTNGKQQTKNKVSIENNLFVAVHILRAMAFLLEDTATTERKEALLKMFFHLISSTRSDKSSRNKNSKNENGNGNGNKERCKRIALAGFEGLAKVLSSNYSIEQKLGGGKTRSVSFPLLQTENGSGSSVSFAIPSTARRKKTNSEASSFKAGSMSVRQLSTIVFQTTMVVVKAMLSLEDGFSLPYGNLLGISTLSSGEFDTSGNEKRICRSWHVVALELLHRIHGPWLTLLASASINEREAAKEVLSYSKCIHRLLWDAASTLKSSSSNSATTNTILQVEKDCLELRKQAILHLLASTGISNLDLLIRKTSFESGCTYAWKAASVFSQHLTTSDSTTTGSNLLLSAFYEDLDSLFARLISINPVVPLEFVEYRMHRSLHIMGSSPSLSEARMNPCLSSAPSFDETSIKDDDISNGNYRVLLQILDLGICSKTRIQGFINSSQHQVLLDENESEASTVIPFLKKLIPIFNRQVIHRMDKIPSDVTNRILKVLCNLSLHKTLFLAMKYHDSEESSFGSSIIAQRENELIMAATILTECLGPLVSAFLNQNPQKAAQLVDLMMECFLRPLSLYEQLIAAHYANINDDGRLPIVARHLKSSMNVCKRITEILTDYNSQNANEFAFPIQCLEKAAKSLYAIARQRNDRSQIEDSIPPLLYSLKLYDKLDLLNGRKKDYQLSSRLFLLSSTFQSIENIHESFFVSCLLMNYESEKHDSTTLAEATKEQNLLNYLGAKSGGLLPPPTDEIPLLPQIIRSLCRQMATNLIKTEAYDQLAAHRAYNRFSIDSTMESFLEEFSGDSTTARAASHPLDSIQRLLQFDEILDHETRLMHVFGVIEILLQSGRSIQQISRGSEFEESQFESAVHNCFLLHSQLQQAILGLDLECPRVVNGLLGLVASASLVPSFSIAKNAWSSDWEKGVNSVLIEAAIEIADESIDNLELPVNCDDQLAWTLLSESLRIVLRNLVVMLQQKTMEENCDGDLFNDCISVAKRLVDAENRSSKTDVISKANYWTIWVVTYLQNDFEIRGDHDQAAILSLWALALAEKIEPHQPWFHALAMTACAKDNNLLRLNKSLATASFHDDAPQGSTDWLFEKEFQLCELRFAALESLSGGLESFHVQMEKAEDIRAELVEYAVEKSNDLFLLYTWVLSTVYLVQTDIASAFGCYIMSLKTSQMCQKCCQTILKRISFGSSNFDDWMSTIATSNVLAMAAQRYIEILCRRPKLHYRLGDHRKALAYTRSILEYLNIDNVPLTSRDDQGHAPNDLIDLLEASPQVRLFLQMNSWAAAPETTMQEFSDIKAHHLNRRRSDDSDQNNSCIVHSIQDMIAVGDILFDDSLSKQFRQSFRAFYQEAATLMTERANVFQVKSQRLPLDIEKHLGMPVADQIKLRDVRRLLESSHESNMESELTIRRICAQVEGSKFSCSEDKAWSLYHLGVLDLEAARCSGALQELWNEHECDQTLSSSVCNDENIHSARYCLSRALLYSSEASDIFSRKILRSLALAEGPKTNNGIGSSSGILVLRSIGQSIRRKLTWAFDEDHATLESESFKNLKDVFSVFDGLCNSDQERDEQIKLFLGELAARTPNDWGFVAPVICPSGEMIVSIIQKTNANPNEFTISTKCIFPPRGENTYDVIMKPLDSILARVQEQLQGVDPSLVSKSDDKEAIKRKWWDERNRLDAEMCGLLEDVESLYFSKIFDMPNSVSNLEESPRGNLTSRFEAAVNESNEGRFDPEEERQEEIDRLKKLTVPKLKERLLSAGASKSQFQKVRKADLIELLIEIEHDNQRNEKVEDTVDADNGDEPITSDSCLFLILDENLHRFPFEGMPVLKGKTVCRIPCLSFVLAKLLELSSGPEPLPSVDPASVSYVLNPENNLQATQDRLLPALQGLASSHRWDWDGVIGDIPPASFFTEAFRKKDGITMYFGHGGAQVCFSRRKVEELIEHRASDSLLDAPINETKKASCKATVLLMGCSSGKLVSINRKNSDSIEEAPLYYEPEGVALSYLCAGAPCVIGNLWDVTDNDIDRLSISLLEDFFGGKASMNDDRMGTASIGSLAKSLSISRSVCKLKHLVGCAPVCYGLPVCLRHNTNAG